MHGQNSVIIHMAIYQKSKSVTQYSETICDVGLEEGEKKLLFRLDPFDLISQNLNIFYMTNFNLFRTTGSLVFSLIPNYLPVF